MARDGCLNGDAVGSRIEPMKIFEKPICLACLLASVSAVTAAPPEIQQELPEPLKPWAGWALWNERDLASPSLMEDGIPLWLHADIELIVAGKSREEALGHILPAGWKPASLESPIPVALDGAGQMKAQVRAGKWTVRLTAFRLDHPAEIAFADGTKPAAADQLVAFKAQPDFRLVEIIGLPAVDVSQTSFPDKWREFPVYRWETATPFRMEERMRGMGLQKPEGLRIRRELWLDQDGGGLTFRDHITGRMQQIWRLDAAESQELGSVRADEQGSPGDGSSSTRAGVSIAESMAKPK